GYDIIGFGSGIAYSRHYKELENAITDIDLTDKKVFVFSTSGISNNENNKTLCDIIKIKGGEIAGSFNCRGYDTYGPFKLVGGIAKGHPNENDFNDAEDFIKEICAE
ncbi:MAG TPA: flavodoxin, partial [Ruminiclostridium sp.]|nr:flavodoxin [Ruminiclostridium sp.]